MTATQLKRGAGIALLVLLVAAVLGSVAAIVLLLRAGESPPDMSEAARPAATARAVRAADAIPSPPVPKVEPIVLADLPDDVARQVNARVPFVTGPVAAAPPFHFTGLPADRERARTCLATAACYEAGDDTVGEAAVIQVVLNRVRHPAFPASVCGVVSQGSERTTGCQFSFTCDGSMTRRQPGPAAWTRARAAADLGLSGFVFRPVGTSTHYHTDWVVPKWGAEFDKVVAIKTHLFFRWRGAWGGRGALRQAYGGTEPVGGPIAGPGEDPAATVAAGDPARQVIAPDIDADTPAAALLPPGVSQADLGKNVLRLSDLSRGQFVVQLDPGAYSGSYAVMSWKLCRKHAPCRVVGWLSGKAMPNRLPLSPDWRDRIDFLYERTGAGGQTVLWNCAALPHPNKDQCLTPTH